jgi:hypothetical protein
LAHSQVLDDDDGFDELFQRNKPTDELHRSQQSQQRARTTPHKLRTRFHLDAPLEETFLFHDAPSWAGGNAAVDLVNKFRETEQKASAAAEGSGAAAMAASTAAVGRATVSEILIHMLV